MLSLQGYSRFRLIQHATVRLLRGNTGNNDTLYEMKAVRMQVFCLADSQSGDSSVEIIRIILRAPRMR